MVGLACGVRSTGAESRRRREPRVVAANRVRVVAPVRVATDSVHGTCRNVWPVVSPRSPQTRAANHGRVRLTAWDPRPRALAESLIRQHVGSPPDGRGIRRWPQALRCEARTRRVVRSALAATVRRCWLCRRPTGPGRPVTEASRLAFLRLSDQTARRVAGISRGLGVAVHSERSWADKPEREANDS